MKYILASKGQVLATRPTGKEIREEIQELLAAHDDGELELSFLGVLALSPSCADELIGRLYSDLVNGDLPKTRVSLSHLTDDHREILLPILKRRSVIAMEREAKEVRLLNGGSHLERTFAVASSLGEFRAADIASREGLTVQAANNRLVKLLKSCLITRTETNAAHGGREYLYAAAG
ncbi:MAG TPA: hypothetical protein VJB57_19915 [Dehalococcoidia bacterium]|nr:hypothetical protein [Dehalococcoidia bacterium]